VRCRRKDRGRTFGSEPSSRRVGIGVRHSHCRAKIRLRAELKSLKNQSESWCGSFRRSLGTATQERRRSALGVSRQPEHPTAMRVRHQPSTRNQQPRRYLRLLAKTGACRRVCCARNGAASGIGTRFDIPHSPWRTQDLSATATQNIHMFNPLPRLLPVRPLARFNDAFRNEADGPAVVAVVMSHQGCCAIPARQTARARARGRSSRSSATDDQFGLRVRFVTARLRARSVPIFFAGRVAGAVSRSSTG